MNRFASREASAKYVPLYRSAQARAKRVTDMRRKRIRALCNAAGLDGSIFPIHLHNYFVDVERGKPWTEVDRSLARKARWLERHLWDADNLVRDWAKRIEAETGYWDYSIA